MDHLNLFCLALLGEYAGLIISEKGLDREYNTAKHELIDRLRRDLK